MIISRDEPKKMMSTVKEKYLQEDQDGQKRKLVINI